MCQSTFLQDDTCGGGTLSFCSNKYTKRFGPDNRCTVCKCRPHLIDNAKLNFVDNHINKIVKKTLK